MIQHCVSRSLGEATKSARALRPRDRDVQPVAGVEELDLPGQVVTGRCSHRDQHNRRFLALELIYGADLSRLRQARPEKVDLHVIRADDQDVADSDLLRIPFAIGPLLIHQALV